MTSNDETEPEVGNDQHATDPTASPVTPAEPTIAVEPKPDGAKKRQTRKKIAASPRRRTTKIALGKRARKPPSPTARFPRHDLDKSLRIPKAILDQNAGHPSTPDEAARFLNISKSGAFAVEISSAKKYGLLESRDGKLAVTDRAKRILRPQSERDEIEALRDAVLNAPDVSDVYNHYRGESLPDDTFFNNTLTDNFNIPADKVAEFRAIFLDSIRKAELIDESGDRIKLVDVGREGGAQPAKAPRPTSSTKRVSGEVAANASCFVMQPFSSPYEGYYDTIFRPAVERANLRPVRADTEIFATGKIMDQVWRGIRSADVLLAELTTKNANVYYELGMAHALGKPVVLIAANESDVPFDLRHIRVIYYDMTDPFWGSKLIDKIADNIISAINNPEEAIFRTEEV